MLRFNRAIANEYETEEILKMVREWTDMNQNDFGRAFGRSRDSVNNFEHGRNKMTLDEFFYMCKKHHIIVILERR